MNFPLAAMFPLGALWSSRHISQGIPYTRCLLHLSYLSGQPCECVWTAADTAAVLGQAVTPALHPLGVAHMVPRVCVFRHASQTSQLASPPQTDSPAFLLVEGAVLPPCLPSPSCRARSSLYCAFISSSLFLHCARHYFTLSLCFSP